MRRLLLLILLIFFATEIFSQSFNFRRYSVDDGLVSSTVYNTFQDSKGFIWFCTDAGVNRFDGKAFEKFSQDEGLSDNEVFRMFEDSRGRIWFLTYNGNLTMFDGKKFHNPDNNKMLKLMVSRSGYSNIFQDTRGRLFFSPYSGSIILLDGDSVQKLTLVTKNMEIYAEGIVELYESFHNEISAFDREVTASIPALLKPFTASEKAFNYGNQYRFIHPGEAFFYNAEGVFHIREDSERKIFSLKSIGEEASKAKLFIDKYRNVWLTKTSGGVFCFTSSSAYQDPPLVYLPGQNISSVYQDKFYNYWFTTLGNGIYFLPSSYKSWSNYSIGDGLDSDDITALKSDQDGNILIGFSNGTLNRLTTDGKIETIGLFNLKEKYCRIKRLAFDESGTWVAADHFICHVSSDDKQVEKVTGFTGSWKDLSVCPVTGKVRVATSRGIFELERSKGDEWLAVQPKHFQSERTFSLFHDSEGILYFANAAGLNIWDGTKYITPAGNEPLFKVRINDFAQADSFLVVATDGFGIYFYRGGEIVNHLSTKDGLPSGICRRIFADKDKIWVATNRGLASINITGDNAIKTYSQSDFILSNDIRDVLVQGDKVYMATDHGLCVKSEGNGILEKNEIPLFFTSFYSGDQNFSIDTLIDLKPGQTTALIRFLALDYEHPQQVLYRYKFDKQGNDWVVTSNNQVEFIGLAPGAYNFQVAASNDNKKWTSPIMLSFRVLPSWWQIKWIRIAGVVVLITLCYYLTRSFFIYRLKKQKAELERRHTVERERNRISSDIHDDLGSGLSQIAILTQIARTDHTLSDHTQAVIQKVSSLSDEMLNKISEIIWAVNPANDTLKNLVSYVHEFSRNYFEGTKFQLHVNIASEIPDVKISSNFRRHVFLIVKESLQNIIKHSDATKVRVFLEVKDSKLLITIADNGKGFNPAMPVRTNGKQDSGYGLNNLKNRSRFLNGDLNIESNEESGTRIQFRAPYSYV